MEKAFMGRTRGKHILAVAACLVMILPPSIFAEELSPSEYASPENSIPAIPAVQKDGSNNPDGTLYRNVTPPINPVMDAWRNYSPLSSTEDKTGQIQPAFTQKDATKFILNFLTQQLRDMMGARRRYEKERAKKTPAPINP